MKHTAVGVDIAKNVFQVHFVEEKTGELVNKQLKREQFLKFFEGRAPCLVGMEACGGAHHWARQLGGQGHKVRLMSARFVKAFNIGNKDDAADAEAIWRAVQQPSKGVAVKTEEQQAVLALHRMREQLVKFRRGQVNCLRGLLAEYGEAAGKGKGCLKKAFERLSKRLPAVLIEALREQWAEVPMASERIKEIEKRLEGWKKEEPKVQAAAKIPGIGLLGATAGVAAMGDPNAFSSGREFSAWVGIVPKQHARGGKVRMQGISKRGDGYLRKLFVDGARRVLRNAQRRGKESPWLKGLLGRRPHNVVVVAIANKMARTLWAVLKHGRSYDANYVRVGPKK